MMLEQFPGSIATGPDRLIVQAEHEQENTDPILDRWRADVVARWMPVIVATKDRENGVTAEFVADNFAYNSHPSRVYEGTSFSVEPEAVPDNLVDEHLAWLGQEKQEREFKPVSIQIDGTPIVFDKGLFEVIFYWQSFNQAGDMVSMLVTSGQLPDRHYSNEEKQAFRDKVFNQLSLQFPEIVADEDRYVALVIEITKLKNIYTKPLKYLEEGDDYPDDFVKARNCEIEATSIRMKYGLSDSCHMGAKNFVAGRAFIAFRRFADDTYVRAASMRQNGENGAAAEELISNDLLKMPLILADLPEIQRRHIQELREKGQDVGKYVKQVISNPVAEIPQFSTYRDLFLMQNPQEEVPDQLDMNKYLLETSLFDALLAYEQYLIRYVSDDRICNDPLLVQSVFERIRKNRL